MRPRASGLEEEGCEIANNVSDSELSNRKENSYTSVEYNLLWKPLYLLGSWKDPASKDNIVSVALLLPTGVGELFTDFELSIENENQLLIGVAWPSIIAETETLHRKWIQGDGVEKITNYHPRIMAFANFIERFQQKEGVKIMSSAKIDLPTPVKPDFVKYFLGFKCSNALVLYIDRQAPDRNFAV